MAELERLEVDDSIVESKRTEIKYKQEDRDRGQWANRVEFFLAIVGYTVGIGSIWRFPILCAKNGGGAFLIPFTFFMVTCGGPLYYLEVCLGQFCGKSATAAFEFCPLFKGIGHLMMTLSFIVVWYDTIVMAWILYFLYCSFSATLPWTTCDNWWNTPACFADVRKPEDMNITANLISIGNQSTFGNATVLTKPASAAFEFWQHNVLRKSEGLEEVGTPQWHLVIGLFFAYGIIVGSVIKGVKSLGKVVYVTATLPYILLTVILIQGLTLDGATDGLLYFLRLDFSALANTGVWIEAAIQVFYSLGPTWGGVITMASYNKFHQKSLWETAICVACDEFSALYSGIVVFTVIGFMAKEASMSVAEVASASGPGLVFIAYPTAVSRMPLSQLWAVIFFLMMAAVAFDSFFGMFETVTSGIVDMYPQQLIKRRAVVNVVVGSLLFILGVFFTTNGGVYLFTLCDWYTTAFALILGSALEAITVCWIYGADRFSTDIAMMTGRQVSVFLRIIWTITLPGCLIVVFVVMLTGYSEPHYGDGYKFKPEAITVGILFGLMPIAAVIFIGIKEIIQAKGGLVQRIKTLLKPSRKWGPREITQVERYRNNPYRYADSVCRRVYQNIRGNNGTPFV